MWWLILCIHVIGPSSIQNTNCSEHVSREACSYLYTPLMIFPSVRPSLQSTENFGVASNQRNKKASSFFFSFLLFSACLGISSHLISCPQDKNLLVIYLWRLIIQQNSRLSHRKPIIQILVKYYITKVKSARENNVHDKQL